MDRKITKTEFLPLWEGFCEYYNQTSENLQRMKLYFSQLAWLTRSQVKEVLDLVMLHEDGYGSIPKLVKVIEHRKTITSRDNVNNYNLDPDLPPIPNRISNINKIQLSLLARTASNFGKSDEIDAGLVKEWVAIWIARERAEVETSCPEAWKFDKGTFKEMLRGFSLELWRMFHELMEEYKKEAEA